MEHGLLEALSGFKWGFGEPESHQEFALYFPLSRRLHIQEADEKKETTCRYRIQGSRWSTQTKPVSSLGLGFLIRATQPAKLTSHGVKSVLALGRELGGHRTCALGTGPTS